MRREVQRTERGRRRKAAAVVIGLLTGFGLFSSGPLSAQALSRAEQIRQARARKAAELQPEVVSATESALNYVNDRKLLERFMAGYRGLRIRLGGLATRQGFAIGPEYYREKLAGGKVAFRSSAQASVLGGQLHSLELRLNELIRNNIFVSASGSYAGYPRIEYYGQGPDSAESDRTNFRLETTDVSLRAGLRLAQHVQIVAAAGMLLVNTGAGNHPGLPSIEEIFSPDSVPGLEQQSDFFKAGLRLQYDTRDNPEGPRSGGNYLARLTFFRDRTLDLHDFEALHLEAQHYVPFFNRRRVVALRLRSVMSFHRDGQSVPFYLQPSLGGSETLRGFQPFRFHDDHQIAATLEYRWESFTGLDMALFADAGRVASRRSDLGFDDLELSTGIGLRFNARNDVFLRMDLGFSREGAQLWFKFSNPF